MQRDCKGHPGPRQHATARPNAARAVTLRRVARWLGCGRELATDGGVAPSRTPSLALSPDPAIQLRPTPPFLQGTTNYTGSICAFEGEVCTASSGEQAAAGAHTAQSGGRAGGLSGYCRRGLYPYSTPRTAPAHRMSGPSLPPGKPLTFPASPLPAHPRPHAKGFLAASPWKPEGRLATAYQRYHQVAAACSLGSATAAACKTAGAKLEKKLGSRFTCAYNEKAKVRRLVWRV
jgi:hypothetical protein